MFDNELSYTEKLAKYHEGAYKCETPWVVCTNWSIKDWMDHIDMTGWWL